MTNFPSFGDCGDAEDPGLVNETSDTSISPNECVFGKYCSKNSCGYFTLPYFIEKPDNNFPKLLVYARFSVIVGHPTLLH